MESMPPADRSTPLRSVPLTGLFVLALFYTAYFARGILIPVVLALLISLLCAPILRLLTQWRIHRALAAAAVVAALVGLATLAFVTLAEPAAEWFQKAPQVMQEIENKIHPLKRKMEEVTRAAEKVEDITSVADGVPSVQVQGATLRSILFGRAQTTTASAVIVAFLLYFFLAFGDLFLRKLLLILPRRELHAMAVETSQQIQQRVSRYLFTVTLINIALGAVVAGLMYLLQMPNPLLWGVMAGLLNFIPYLGAVVSLTVVTVVALLTFDSTQHALLVPLVFLVATTLEGQLITPVIVGLRLSLNPVVVFLGVVFWGWLWGVPGALMAVPLMAAIKIIADHVPRFTPLGEMLGR